MFDAHDEHELAHDINLLDTLTEDILERALAPGLGRRIRALRAAARARRSEAPPAAPPSGAAGVDALAASLAAWSWPELNEAVRALSQHFANRNLAERVHRVRRRRAAWGEHGRAQRGGLIAVMAQLRAEGTSAQDIADLLTQLAIEPVFTAHPTEATRRTLLRKEQRMARALLQRHRTDLLPQQRRGQLALLRQELVAAWQTEDLAEAPTVADEVEHIAFYLTQVLYPIVPAFYEGLEEAAGQALGAEGAELCAAALAGMRRPIVRFGTWVGGDMDGNPAVGAATAAAALGRQREMLLQAYLGDVQRLLDALSQSASRVAISAGMRARLEAAQQRCPAVQIPPRHRNMPYRELLHHVAHRLRQSGAAPGDAGAYGDPAELEADLSAMAESLEAHGGTDGGAFAVRRLLRRVQTFGLHLAALDVRQDALVYRRAAAELLGAPQLLEQDAHARTATLARAIDEHAAGDGRALRDGAAAAPADGPLQRTLAVFAAIGTARAALGPDAIGLCLISMAQDVDDVLAVLLLARAAGLVQADAQGRTEVPLDVAPLFETVPDLQRSGAVLQRMAAHPVVRAHLRRRGDVQHVMLGYSDSNKESGYLASRCALLAAEEALAAAAQAHALQLRLFHGRGGTASRGGSKPRDAILADPLGSPALRLTEQGEIIHAKYGLPDMALRTLELMGSAMLERALGPGTPAPGPGARAALMACAEASRAHYRALVAETPDFFAYFNAATPIDVIMRLRIGSRPASRRAHEGIGDLRAIPWVFSWMQNRQMLPGWFGLGYGLERGIAEHGLALFADMARSWPYFQVALRDAAAVLAKSDMAIGARYAALAGAAGAPIWARIAEEHARATAQILRITGAPTLLHHEPQLQRSIEARNPKVDVLSLVQLRALPAWREGGRTDPELLEVLLRSVKGIARALQNTG